LGGGLHHAPSVANRKSTIIGRAIRVKGIGSRTTSPLEKLIENVVVGVLPSSGQSFFAKLQSSAAKRQMAVW
jgi:hypothetical protein